MTFLRNPFELNRKCSEKSVVGSKDLLNSERISEVDILQIFEVIVISSSYHFAYFMKAIALITRDIGCAFGRFLKIVAATQLSRLFVLGNSNEACQAVQTGDI